MSTTAAPTKPKAKAPAETLIDCADELMAAIGKLRKIEPGIETSPLARLLDTILDTRTTLMRARDAARKEAKS